MDKRKGMMDQARNVRKSGMGRLYGQLGAIGEGLGATLNGIGEFIGAGVQGIINMVKSAGEDGLKAHASLMVHDYKGAEKYGKSAYKKADKEAAKSEKQMSQALEKSVQGLIYAISGLVDVVMLGVEIATDAGLALFTLGTLNNQNTGLTGKYNEGNYELQKFRNGNQYQENLNKLGTRMGQEMQENDEIVDFLITSGLVVASFIPGAASVTVPTLIAYKAMRGAYEGGAGGAAAGAVAGAINT
ncbi:hypothetical protein EHQ07_04910, partial [Leptospira gomenensis]